MKYDSHRISQQNEGHALAGGEPAPRNQKRWAVILAGGDGTRLQGLTRFICGDDRPKQFCPIINGHTLLAHTVRRVQRTISSEQMLFALTRTHRKFYQQELEAFERHRIVQPTNKGTAPPILFSVLSIERMDREAIVAVIPSDHHYSDEAQFTHALESAFEIAAERPESVVLVGAEPDRLELEYGWIELGPHVARDGSEVRHVREFWEKPRLDIAQALLGRGDAVWNTFVMVGHVGGFLEIIRRAIPKALDALRHSQLWVGNEIHIAESVYRGVPPSDFSKGVLSVETARLLVLRARDLGWSDLGHPGRVLAALEQGGSNPSWIKGWRQMKPAATVTQAEIDSAVA